MWVSTHPAYKAVSFTMEQAYLANQKPFWTATLDIFVTMNGVMGSMWCGLQRSTWITSSSETKGLWSKLIATKTQTALSLCPYRHHVHAGPHWLDVHQSAGIVADNFLGPALILQATILCTWIKACVTVRMQIVYLLDRFEETEWQLLSLCNIALLFLSVSCSVISQHGAQVLSSPLNSPVWKGSQRGFDAPTTPHPTPKSLSTEASTHVYNTDDLRTTGMRHVIVEEHSLWQQDGSKLRRSVITVVIYIKKKRSARSHVPVCSLC